MPQQQLKVMISSTARDLPEHRKEAMDACLRQGMFPIMMEYLPASDAEAIAASSKMVDDADIYVLILAHRYGYVPKGHSISVTEMEYNRAVERKIRRAVFVVDKTQSLSDFTIADIDTGENAAKLKDFKERCEKENIVNFFRSPADLRADLINSLSQYREADLTTFHYVSDIPAPPEAFIAHPYTLLQTPTLIGRQSELRLLTDWITGKELEADGRKAASNSVRIMNVVAIGGLGKSALTWKWFNDIAPEEMKSLAGRMWWSFYESDASFENFVTRALAYVTRAKLEEVQQIPAPECETQLLAALDREPFLIVLDGLERILIAYARMDASRLDDSQVGREKGLRKTADPRVGNFLKRLTQVKNSRILVSSRLYPAELETDAGDPILGSFRCDITGLTDEDAVELWRAFGVRGSRDELLPVFTTFGKHPLLIQALAGKVNRYRRAPGNFEEWRKGNPRFDPAQFPDLTKAMGHVLEFALRGLDKKVLSVLHTISAFRMPATYDTLTALLVGKSKTRFELSTGKVINEEGRLFDEEAYLDEGLTELEDRGLVGWDKRANRYDLHPIVRGVVWNGLREETQRGVYRSLHAHFEALPQVTFDDINSLEDLTPVIELYNTLIGLGRYDDAEELFAHRLERATLHRLNANRQRVELLEMLFPNGLDCLPRLSSLNSKGRTINALALSSHAGGQPAAAAALFRRASAIASEMKRIDLLGVCLINLAETLRQSGALCESETAVRRALLVTRDQGDRNHEGHTLYWLGLTLAVRGNDLQSSTALDRSLRLAEKALSYPPYDYQAMRALWFGHFKDSYDWAAKALRHCEVIRFERGSIRATRVQGEAALGMGDFATADGRLHHALTRARMVNLFEEELPALVALAALRWRQGDLRAAREFLDDVWEAAERGPYPLIHADAYNVLAQIERDEGNNAAAVEAATKAYRLARCDGPPFAYHWGLKKAKKHLQELGAPEPEMPPFDESKFEPMPEVEIDPDDEFHEGKAADG